MVAARPCKSLDDDDGGGGMKGLEAIRSVKPNLFSLESLCMCTTSATHQRKHARVHKIVSVLDLSKKGSKLCFFSTRQTRTLGEIRCVQQSQFAEKAKPTNHTVLVSEAMRSKNKIKENRMFLSFNAFQPFLHSHLAHRFRQKKGWNRRFDPLSPRMPFRHALTLIPHATKL